MFQRKENENKIQACSIELVYLKQVNQILEEIIIMKSIHPV